MMFLVMDVGWTATICIFIIFIMVILLFSDLMDVYLNSENQFAELVDNGADGANPQSDRKFLGI